MNAVPMPADLSKLKGILSKAKSIIKNDGNFEGGNLDGSKLRQDTSGYVSEQHLPSGQQGHQHADPVRSMGAIDESTIMNSGLPQAVKDMYLKNPPQVVNPMGSFSLEDMGDLVEKPLPMPSANGQRRQVQPQQSLNENVMVNNDKITVSEAILRGIIKDVLLEFLTTDYTKNLTEGVIKKTINTLIKEGKIKTKK
jgi:hypothetical protein